MTIFESSADDVLGLWEVTSPPAGAVSFGAGTPEDQPAEEIYRTNLPSDPQAAREIFRSSQQMLAQVNLALNQVPGRLDGLVIRTNEQRQGQPGAGGSFAAGPAGQEAGPEGDLLAMLAEADQGGGDVSFGIGESTNAAWEAARARLKALMAQIDRDVLHFAWVETSISGRLVARTTVDWSGDLLNYFNEDIDINDSLMHENTLKNVTLTRHLRLRLFATVAAGAVKVATLMTAPGGVVLALPAVFQYVLKIVEQAKQLQSIQTAQGA